MLTKSQKSLDDCYTLKSYTNNNRIEFNSEFIPRTEEQLKDYEKGGIKESPFQIEGVSGIFTKPIRAILTYVAKKVAIAKIKELDNSKVLENTFKKNIKDHLDRVGDRDFRAKEQSGIDRMEHRERMDKFNGKETRIA